MGRGCSVMGRPPDGRMAHPTAPAHSTITSPPVSPVVARRAPACLSFPGDVAKEWIKPDGDVAGSHGGLPLQSHRAGAGRYG